MYCCHELLYELLKAGPPLRARRFLLCLRNRSDYDLQIAGDGAGLRAEKALPQPRAADSIC